MIAKGTSRELADSLRRLAELIEDGQIPMPVMVAYHFDNAITLAANCDVTTMKYLAHAAICEIAAVPASMPVEQPDTPKFYENGALVGSDAELGD